MDDDLQFSSIFDNAKTFADYTHCVRTIRPQVHHEEAGSVCELKHLNCLYNSDGKQIVLQSGSQRFVGREYNSEGFLSALIKTTFWGKKGDELYTETEVQSPHMKEALKANIPEYRDANIDSQHIVFRNEPHCLFYFRNELFLHGFLLEDPVAQSHVSFLLEHIRQVFWDAICTYQTYIEQSPAQPAIDFPNLWTVFMPGELVYVPRPHNRRTKSASAYAFQFESMDMSCRCDKPYCSRNHCWQLRGHSFDCDGGQLGYRRLNVVIRKFSGFMALSEMTAIPLRYHPQQDEIRQHLLARGRKFIMLQQGAQHQQYNGIAEVLSKDRSPMIFCEEDYFPLHSTWIKGRILVDPATFYEARPGHEIYFESSRARFPREDLNAETAFTEEQYIMCNHETPGFCLHEKMWAFFSVDLIKHVDYDADVFTSTLLLDDKYKSTMVSLVRMYTERSGQGFEDVIKGKGTGLVFLLHGDSGVGKTLTAESIADHCKRPLLRIDASTIGLTATSAEAGMEAALSLAERWKAVALLDEADVFMEQRSISELERNSLVAVFLRVLEYYGGILFLTTNRVGSFDRAFKSRVQLAVHYPALNQASRKKLWRHFVGRTSLARHMPVNDSDSPPGGISGDEAEGIELDRKLELLAAQDLNGRQIKNIVHVAESVAIGAGVTLTTKHLEDILATMNEFDAEFERENERGRVATDALGGGDGGRGDAEGSTSRKRRRLE